MKESDLYPYLKEWLEKNGYEPHAEVNGCDIAARKPDEPEELIIIEMKLRINLELILQLVARQQTRAAVYAAVPAPRLHTKRWRQLERLLKRLEAGLLLVHMTSALPRVEVKFHPVPYVQPKRRDATRALLKEMSGRTVSHNIGGSTRKKLITAYRESSLAVAVALEATGATSPKTLRTHGAPEKTGDILRGNPYGWFEKLDKALYGLTPEGKAALRNAEYAPLVAALRENQKK